MAQTDTKIAEVVISISNSNIDKIYDYLIEDDLTVKEGTRVVVPFGIGNMKVCAYVLGIKDETSYKKGSLKKVLQVIDENPIISREMLEIAKWMKHKYYTTYAKCLQCILPTGIKSKKSMSKNIRFVRLKADNDFVKENMRDLIDSYYKRPALYNQAQVLELLFEHEKVAVEEIRQILFISESPLKTLQKKGLIEYYKEEIKADLRFDTSESFIEKQPIVLNDEQQLIFDGLTELLKAGKSEEVLIHGITGSGKTEIYLRLIDETINSGKQAIMLVPEISLTPQTTARFTNRFGGKVTVTHSKMSLTERYDQWRRALDSEVSIMIGPRSAVFTPFNNLGIIIIDEEHDQSYKSEIAPKFDAREVAKKRLGFTGGLLVLGTATPSIETYYNALSGKIKLYSLMKRATSAPLPEVTVVDMRKELLLGNRTIFSGLLKDEIECCLCNKEQVILFLNRRGYASFVSCRTCGYVIKCDDCNVSYTYHKFDEMLVCHYCGAKIPNPNKCPECESVFIKQFGSGTQKVERDIKKLFPDARTLRMDLDTVSGKNAHQSIISRFADGEADILIGTQMIAKGHDFGNVTLVGIVAADISLNSGSFRSAETAFQLMTQVSGRAGRAKLPGKVVAQTYNPEHYAIVHAKTHDYKGFYDEEITIRKSLNYPPFCSLFVVQLSGEDEKKIIIASHQLLKIMEHYKARGDYEVIGPAPCYISRIKRQFRWKILIKSADPDKLTSFCLYSVQKLKTRIDTNEITFNLNLNPYSVE